MARVETMGDDRPSSDGWRRVRFGDVVRNVKENVDPVQAGIERYVAGEHMDTDDLPLRRWGKVGVGYLGPAFHRKFVKGQVLYGSRRTYLRKVAVARFDGVCANTTFVLESASEDLLPELLPFIMQTEAFNEHSVKQSKGSVNPYVNWKDLAWYEFALPSKPEQERIADILWAAVAVEDAWLASRAVLESIAPALSGALLGGISLSLEFERDTGLICLSEVVPKDAPIRYGIVQVGLDDRNGVPTLAIKDLGGDYSSGVHRTHSSHEMSYAGSRVREGDVLLSIKGSIGRVDVVPKGFEGNISRDLARIRPQAGILPAFVANLLRSGAYQRLFQRYAVGSTRQEISIHLLRRLPFPRLPMSEQRRLSDLLDLVQYGEAAAVAQLRAVRQLRRDLLERMTEGSARV